MGEVYYGSQSEGLANMVGRPRQQELEVGGWSHLNHSQEAEGGMPVLSSLSPLCGILDPSSWGDTPLIHSGSSLIC